MTSLRMHGLSLLFLVTFSGVGYAGMVGAPTPSTNLLGSTTVLNSGTTHTFTASATNHYVRIEANENDGSIGLIVDFFHDIGPVPDGVYAGDGTTEDTDLDPDFSGTLTGGSNQFTYEWQLSSLTIGNDYGVFVTFTEDDNGPDRIQFGTTSTAVPEPSSFLLLALVGSGFVGWRLRRKFWPAAAS